MPPRKNSAGRWEAQFWTPRNVRGLKRRLYVVCPPAYNTPAMCRQLMREAIDRHLAGVVATNATFAAFAREKFLAEYPAARGLRRSSRELLEYLLERIVIPEIGTVPLGAVDAATVARLCGKLRADRKPVPATTARARGPLARSTIRTVLAVARRLRFSSSDFPPGAALEDAAKAFLDAKRESLTPGSFAIYAQMVRLHLLPNLGDKARVGDLTDDKLAALATRLEAGDRAPTPRPTRELTDRRRFSDRTIRHVVMAIKLVLAWAEKVEQLPKAPTIELPRVADARRPQPYTPAEARRLIAAAVDETERAMFVMAFDAGPRRSELLGLTWEQVNFDRHELLFDRQRYRGTVQETKSGRQRRVPMSGALEAALRKLRHLRGPFVFCDDVGRPFEEHHLRTRFERARRKAGLRRVRWHDHRHAFSTMQTDAGVPAFALQALLGHADVRTTQGYVHPSTERLSSVLDPEVA